MKYWESVTPSHNATSIVYGDWFRAKSTNRGHPPSPAVEPFAQVRGAV